MNEFAIIKNFFTQQRVQRDDVVVAIGDDAAILQPPTNQQLVITVDTLIAGVHFPKETSPFDIGYKSLAVNLSDLAAMGATPTWITLALTLPTADEVWLKEFSHGLFSLAERYQVQLIGGDTTRGPLSITIQAHGFVSPNQAIKRNSAKVGDGIYVTHTLGDAAGALALLKKNESVPNILLTHLNRPEPQIEISQKLRGIAHAAIDISDGLAADLGHILTASHKGAIVYVDKIPLSAALCAAFSHKEALELAINGGDDYELCVTAPADFTLDRCTKIGEVVASPGLDLRFTNGEKYNGNPKGYQHF